MCVFLKANSIYLKFLPILTWQGKIHKKRMARQAKARRATNFKMARHAQKAIKNTQKNRMARQGKKDYQF